MPRESIDEAIKLYADIVRRPHLPGDQLEDARMMMMQELRAIEDEPAQRVMRRVREMQFGTRLGRGSQGTAESLAELSAQDVQEFYQTHYNATQSILTVAGDVQPEQILELADATFGDWRNGEESPLIEPDGHAGYEHFQAESSQTHIAFSFPSIWYGHPEYFRMRAGIGILSDGMSSRLFDRVREKRGLCYTVSASCQSLRNAGGVFGYAGTTPQRAQETLDVTLHEIDHLTDDLHPDELDRWKVRIESGLIMEQESSASRASSLASDFIQLGRTMSTEEISDIIASLTLDEVRSYWTEHTPSDHRIVTLGTESLQVPCSATT